MKKQSFTPSFGDKLDNQLFSVISLAGFIITFGIALFTFPLGYVKYSLFNVGTGVICLLTYFLAKSRRFTLSFWLFFLFLPILMVLYTYNFGLINADFYLISGLIVVSYLVRSKKYWGEIIWIFTSLLFVVSKFILYSGGKYVELSELEQLLFFPNLISSLVLIFIATSLFRNRQEEQRNELKSSLQIKDKLLYLLSHDIRTPFHTLNGIINLIEAGAMEKGELKENITSLKNDLKFSNGMLDNLLLWIKSQNDGIKPYKEPVNLRIVILDNLELFKHIIEDKKLEIKISAESAHLHSDKEMLKTVVRNLLSNAIKFSPKETGKIELCIADSEKHYKLSITDNGPGIPKSKRGKLFEGVNSERGSENEKGFGVGLQLVGMFCERLNIDIEVNSEMDEGTTFVLHIPKD